MPPLSSILTAAGALGAVLLLIFLASRTARLSGLARPGGKLLAIEETVALDQRRRLQLVRCENQRFLLLTGGSQDVVIDRLPGKEVA